MTKIRTLLQQLLEDESQLATFVYAGFSENQKNDLKHRGLNFYQGKVRELAFNDGSMWIYHTDRLSAFDRDIGLVPFKGLILATLSSFWFQKVKEIIPNHLVSVPHPRVMQVKNLSPIKLEVIVRGYLAGGIARSYQKGQRQFSGNELPDGLSDFAKLPQAIITPTTKAAVYEHDEEISPAQIIELGLCTQKEWASIGEMSLRLFDFGRQYLDELGVILVDTKYEFGRSKEGEIILMDEIHTPDSSRLWLKDSYEQRLRDGLQPEMFDKEIVRRFLLDKGFSGYGDVPKVPMEVLINLALSYLDIAEKIMGRELDLNSHDFADLSKIGFPNSLNEKTL